jgi:hypothetical protein
MTTHNDFTKVQFHRTQSSLLGYHRNLQRQTYLAIHLKDFIFLKKLCSISLLEHLSRLAHLSQFRQFKQCIQLTI